MYEFGCELTIQHVMAYCFYLKKKCKKTKKLIKKSKRKKVKTRKEWKKMNKRQIQLISFSYEENFVVGG